MGSTPLMGCKPVWTQTEALMHEGSRLLRVVAACSSKGGRLSVPRSERRLWSCLKPSYSPHSYNTWASPSSGMRWSMSNPWASQNSHSWSLSLNQTVWWILWSLPGQQGLQCKFTGYWPTSASTDPSGGPGTLVADPSSPHHTTALGTPIECRWKPHVHARAGKPSTLLCVRWRLIPWTGWPATSSRLVPATQVGLAVVSSSPCWPGRDHKIHQTVWFRLKDQEWEFCDAQGLLIDQRIPLEGEAHVLYECGLYEGLRQDHKRLSDLGTDNLPPLLEHAATTLRSRLPSCISASVCVHTGLQPIKGVLPIVLFDLVVFIDIPILLLRITWGGCQRTGRMTALKM